MAVHKAIRSTSSAQPQRRRRNSQPNDPHLKPELFDTLRQLNRGYGVSLAALDRLQRRNIFPRDCLLNYHNRTENLRALANHDLLRLLSGRERLDAQRFERLSVRPVK